MDKTPVDDRSPMAKSLSKVSEITAICLLMIVPALVGYLIDQKIGTGFILTLIGLLIGMVGSVLQLMQLVKSTNQTMSGRSSFPGNDASDKRDE